jgi:hypothetical protein
VLTEHDNLRDLSHSIRPVVLSDRGLLEAVEAHAAPAPSTRVSGGRAHPEECVDAPLAFRAPGAGEADGSSAPPAQVDDDRPVVGRVDAIDRLSTDVNARDDHELTLSAWTKEDVVNAPIDQLGASLKWCRRM